MTSRRNRLVLLLALASLAVSTPLASSTATAEPLPACGLPATALDVVWTGDGGDGLWDTAGNWVDGDGAHRVPTFPDRVCIEAADGTVHAPDGLDAGKVLVEGTSADPVLDVGGVVAAQRIESSGTVEISGDARIRADLEVARLEVDAGAEAIVETFFRGYDGPSGWHLDVVAAGELILRQGGWLGSITVPAGGLVGTIPRADQAAIPPNLVISGAVDVDPGGHVALGHRVRLEILSTATLLGEPMDLHDLDLMAASTFPVTVRGDVGLADIPVGRTVTVAADESDVFQLRGAVGADTIVNRGTLVVDGPPAGRSGNLPYGETHPNITNDGTLELDGTVLRGVVTNTGTTRLSGFNMLSGQGVRLHNRGRLEVGRRCDDADDRPSPIGATLYSTATVENTGTIVATDPSAEISVGRFVGAGPIGGRLNVGAVTGSDDPGLVPAGAAPLTVPDLGWGAGRTAIGLRGAAGPDADRVRVTGTLLDLGMAHGFDLDVADGYVPCAGDRWQLMTFGRTALGYRSPGDPVAGDVAGASPGPVDVTATGLPVGVGVHLERRFDGYVAVAGGSAPGAPCSEPLGERLVSGWFVDGLGRPATTTQLATFGARAASSTGRVAVARELLGGEAATRRFVDTEIRRILGRPASALNLLSYDTRIRKGLAPDAMRAEVYGDLGFYATSGRTIEGWADAFYRTELGRPVTEAERVVVRRCFRAGLDRATIARYLLAGAEADRALAARSIELWWARPATAAERATWGARYQAGAERHVTADLAAADPIG